MYDVMAIKNYILFLKTEFDLSVTLHTGENDSLIVSGDLYTFNIHDNSYCIYIKTCEEARCHCVERQPCIIEKCKNGAFSGACYAGVFEYVYPITDGIETVGFISVSGYKCENQESYIKRMSEKYGLSYDNLKNVYNSLKEQKLTREKIDTLIFPLCQMIELAYMKNNPNPYEKLSQEEKIERYLKSNHTENISLSDIAKQFLCSKSHISHIFKKKTGKSIREYINDLRISDAKTLLEYSGLTVTEIAFSVGFTDSDYFSNVFKKCVGVSPMAYRKNFRKL